MSDDTETLAEHWHWDEDDAGAFRCGYVERREPCPVPERLYVLTPDDLAARIVQARAGEGALAEAWERGWADAQRSAYTAPLPHENPYRALTDTAGDPT